MKELKYRHEIKHYINLSDYMAIRNRLKLVMSLDRNADENREYTIRSLYFDNFEDKALREKVDGINRREKFRIRLYNNEDSFIRLEKKMKNNGLCAKVSEAITKDECISIINGNIDFLRDSGKPLFIELYTKMKNQLLKPMTIVEYTREAYVYRSGNVRITFDKSIRTGIKSINLFDKNLPTVEVIDNRFIVLEVKYDEFLPEIIHDIIQVNERRATAVSKYAAARLYG